MKGILQTLKLKFAVYQNENAFTLLEVLFAFSVFTTIVFFIAPVFHISLNDLDSPKRLQAMEWDVFCSQIKKEIHISPKADVVSGRLILMSNSDIVYYEKYGNNLRRRVNSTGHEIALQNVQSVNFIRQNNAVKIIVIDIWGKEYSVLVHSYINGGT